MKGGSISQRDLYCAEAFNKKYLEGTLQLLRMASQTSTRTQAVAGDVDALEFLKVLREELIDQYTAILMGCESS